jgi:hypothetical protein
MSDGSGAPLVRTGNDHCTPQPVLDVLYGYDFISLDPCSNPWSRVGAIRSLSAHRGEDGLLTSWSLFAGGVGFVFANPPYGRGLIKPWVAKCIDEAITHELESILLVPADPTTSWARLARTFCSAWGPWASRIAFDGAGGAGAKQPSALYHFGPNKHRFAHHFEEHLAFVQVMPR